ncbi:MAG: DNA primase [Patescibacteria group bacterium]|jgi:DNA primase
MQISDEIKTRLDIVDVIREYVPNLKAVGMNFSALSPFKREKTPSFVVSPAKQIWHCFSTGKGGDVIKFVMEMEGLSFVEALRVLAPKAGVVLKRENPAETSRRNRLLDALEAAVAFYHQNLLESPLASAARDYIFKKRGLSEKTVMDWQVGYSPDSWDDLILYLKKRNYTDAEIFAAGLSAKKEGRNSFFNRFRGRIMFPINEVNGSPVAFTARVSPEKEATEMMGKYVNSPETPLYSKSKIVFGLDKAKMAIKESGYCIIVEGQMDCISCHQAGWKNVVASSGTAFTAEQLKLIKRYSNNIAFSFDMDEAGQLAADRAIREAMTAEFNIKVITIPSGKDPDELIRNNPEAWRESVKESKSLKKYIFDKNLTDLDISSPEAMRGAELKIFPLIKCLNNEIEKDVWFRDLATVLNVSETGLRQDYQKFIAKEKNNFIKKTEPEEAPTAVPSQEEKTSESLLALILRWPLFFSYVVDKVSGDLIFGKTNKTFYNNLNIYYNEVVSGQRVNTAENWLDYSSFKAWLNNNLGSSETDGQDKLLDKITVLGERDYFSLDSTKAKNELIKIISSLRKTHYWRLSSLKEKEIALAEKSGDMVAANRALEELTRLKEEMRLGYLEYEE